MRNTKIAAQRTGRIRRVTSDQVCYAEKAIQRKNKQLTLMLDTTHAGSVELMMKARFADNTLLAVLCPRD